MNDKDKKINQLCIEYADCQLCPYGNGVFVDKEPYRVFYKGNTNARVVLIGEGPGKDEILCGKPFVGAAGKQLVRILEFAKIPLTDCFVTNSFICSNDGYKKPIEEVMVACNNRLKRMIEIVRPKIVITLGMYAWQSIKGLDTAPPLKQYLENVYTFSFEHKPGLFLVVPEYHPSYYLRNPRQKKAAAKRWKYISKVYQRATSN